MKIGFFDSGIGGLTVLHQALHDLPEEEYIYYADTDHVPYGQRSKEEILLYTEEAVRFLIRQDVKAIVIACNTATSAAIELLRRRYPLPILGMEPAVKPAVAACSGKRVLVTATPLTIREEKLRNLLRQVDRKHAVDLLPLPGLVHFAEAEEFSSPAVYEYLQASFAPYDLNNYSALVLGCTHFNYFKDLFSVLLPSGAKLIDGSQGTIRHLEEILRNKRLLASHSSSSGHVDYYFSGRKAESPSELARFRRLHKRLEEMLAY